MNSPYPYLKAAPTEHGLILQEGEFKLVTPNPVMLRGTIEWSGGVLDIASGEVTPAEVGGLPLRFAFTGTGRSDTYHYYGYQTPWWQKGDDNQRSILVGSVFRKPSGEAAPVGSVYPFIAVKKQ